MILSAAELEQLTKRQTPAAQARVLRRLAIPFRAHPIDGCLLVDREAARAALGAMPAAEADAAADEYTVNVEGIRKHGSKTKPGRSGRAPAARAV